VASGGSFASAAAADAAEDASTAMDGLETEDQLAKFRALNLDAYDDDDDDNDDAAAFGANGDDDDEEDDEFAVSGPTH
jgi:hypothetical protein